MLDLIISGGTVVDGTGVPGKRADVGIAGGRVVTVGEVDDSASRTIDADGLVVAPGFVDIHTHYDAQVFWDGGLTPSSIHGVTTVVGGNCGFSIAPLTDDSGEYLMNMLARVEGMPLDSLRQGCPWDWRSFADYLDALEGNISINAGFLVGHCAIRRAVMGERSVGEKATAEDLSAMEALLEESLEGGGLGFSSTWAPTHNDGAGQPVPSRHADREELLRLCRATGRHEGTTLEFIPAIGEFSPEIQDLMASMSCEADRPLNWNVLTVQSFMPDVYRAQLEASDLAAAQGGRVVALSLPQTMSLRLNLTSGFILDALPEWAPVLALPLDERRRAFADPDVRSRLAAGAASPEAGLLGFLANWENMTIAETFEPANKELAGRKLGEVAAERGKSPFEVFCDLSVDEDLRTSFSPFIPGDDEDSWKLRAEVWQDERVVVGGSDAGAHLDMIDTFACATTLLGPGRRDRGLIGLEDAVHQLTDVPARLYGLKGRGRLAEGWAADVCVFDPETIGPKQLHTRSDLPAGASRLYAEAAGIEHVIVGGTEAVCAGELTGDRPGRVLRSGRDTETVRASA
ncbi:MAG: amidohydrolase family protein [Deltaproteobacteria bacterium]